MSEKRELSRVQQYAVKAAMEKVKAARAELQSLLNDIAVELGINLSVESEKWELTADQKYLERRSEYKSSSPEEKQN